MSYRIEIVNNNVKLHLPNTSTRNIGTLSEDGTVFNVYREYHKHLFRKFNAFGFNLNFLESNDKLKTVVIKTNKGENFSIPKDYILNSKNRSYLHFKKQGFEVQVFIPVIDLRQKWNTKSHLENTIKIGDYNIKVNHFDTQLDKDKRPFRLSATEKHKEDYIHTFKYTDVDSEYFKIKTDINLNYKNEI